MTYTWQASLIAGRDAFRVVGTPSNGSAPWVLEIDALLAIDLAPTGHGAGKVLFRLCQQAADSGMTPQEFAGILQHRQAPPPLPSALWDKPTKIETEMLAYRGWNVDTEFVEVGDDDKLHFDLVLRSVSQTSKWLGPVFRAHKVPDPSTNSGVYAVGTDDRHFNNFHGYVISAPVWGEVSLSGLVVEGQNGYRAEVCTIRRLWINPGVGTGLTDSLGKDRFARILAQRYQVDLPSVRQPVFEWVQEMERARKDRDAMFTQATGSVVR